MSVQAPGSGFAATPSRDLAIVIVSYNVRDLLRRCLVSVLHAANQLDANVDVIVVDNASQDGSADMVRVEFPSIYLLALPTNVGFAAGNNAALRMLVPVPATDTRSFVASPPAYANAQAPAHDDQYILLLKRCTSFFRAPDGALLPEFDAFTVLPWAEALPWVGRNLRRVLGEVRAGPDWPFPAAAAGP